NSIAVTYINVGKFVIGFSISSLYGIKPDGFSDISNLPIYNQILSTFKFIDVSALFGACYRAGCSSQLCVDEKDKDIVTTCEYREEYGCYQGAKCERQTNGQCGFTPSMELSACLEKAAQ
ncbi:MAG: hypothetical protein Q7S28_00650, partial [bacterium]|nr:hypothetical protein [bacterium]